MYLDLDKRHIHQQTNATSGYGYNIRTLVLKPEIKAWLEEQRLPNTSEIIHGNRGLISFSDSKEAMLFKLRWM